MLVESCGGFANTCREGILEGAPELHLDPENGTATLPAGELRFAEEGREPFPLEIPLADLHGTLDGPTIRFFTPTDFLQYVEWTMTLTAEGLVLQGVRRFAVEAGWTDFAGQQGKGRAIELNADSGSFWFFDADNTEIVVKVLDACEDFGRFWVFAAGLTNVGVELVVTDLASGVERRYANPVGQAFQPILDTDAFETCDVP